MVIVSLKLYISKSRKGQTNMTKKDYIVIAKGAKRGLMYCKKFEKTGLIFAIDCIAIELQRENKRFDIKKFWDYINKK